MMYTSQPSASNWKRLLLWEGQDSFILGSVLTGKIDFSMCWEKYFVISCLWRRLKRGNARKRKICVTSTEGRVRNSASSRRIWSCRPSWLSSQTPLTSFGFLFSFVTQSPDLVPLPCTHAWALQNAMARLLWGRTGNQMSLKEPRVGIWHRAVLAALPLVPGLV